MESMHAVLNETLEKFKKGSTISIKFTEKELNLIKVVISNFLADIKYKDFHKEGNDVSDYVRESIIDITEIYDKIEKHREKI